MIDASPPALAGSPMAIGVRIAELLARHGKPQAWLARQTLLEPSTVSRVIHGGRFPTIETLEHVAQALGITVAHLVHGTDAEKLLQEAARLIPREHYEAAVKQVAEYETKIYDLESRLRTVEDQLRGERERREVAVTERCQLQIGLDRAELDHAEAQKNVRALSKDLREHRQALHMAVAEISNLRSQLTELAEALKANGRTTRTSALLAGIAALTGAVTVAHFLQRTQPASQNGIGDPIDSVGPQVSCEE